MSVRIIECPRSIPADGSADVSADMTDWINSGPNGTGPNDRVIYACAKDGNYRSDGIIKPIGKQWWAIAGRGAAFQSERPRAERWWPFFEFDQCANFFYNDLHLFGRADPNAGYRSDLEAQHGFAHQSSIHSTSTRCTVTDTWGDAWNFAYNRPGEREARDHTVDNATIGYVHRDPVALTGALDITFTNCDMGRTPRTGVDMEPNSSRAKVQRVLFEDCVWRYHRLNWVASVPEDGLVTDVTFRRCKSLGAPCSVVVGCDPSIEGAGRSNFTFDSCWSDTPVGNPKGAAMLFNAVDGDLVVVNNYQRLQQRRPPPAMRVARWDAWTEAHANVVYEGNTLDVDAA